MGKNWVEWHDHYDDPNSSLIQRLKVVQHDLRRALRDAPADEESVVRLVSICAGEGRDVLPVLAEVQNRRVSALLVELNPVLSRRARLAADALGLSGVEIRTADAGLTDTYRNVRRAHVLTVCGVFGHLRSAEMRQTVAFLPSLVELGGIVIWTRSGQTGDDPSLEVRSCFLSNGFSEMSFEPTQDDAFRIGMHRLEERLTAAPASQAGTRIFTFS